MKSEVAAIQLTNHLPIRLGMGYKLAGFDFDGTLADSADWFLDTYNNLAEEFGFKTILPGERGHLRGLHSRELLKQLGVPTWKLPRLAVRMRALAKRDRHQIRLFPGIPKLFRDLHRQGIDIAIVSSNGEETIQEILGTENSRLVTQYACGVSLFGKAARLRALLRRLTVNPSDAIYIGDELRDAIAAREAGMHFGAVAWGYATPEALLSRSPDHFFREVAEIAPRLTPQRFSAP